MRWHRLRGEGGLCGEGTWCVGGQGWEVMVLLSGMPEI